MWDRFWTLDLCIEAHGDIRAHAIHGTEEDIWPPCHVADIDKMEEPMLTEYERDLKNYRDRLFVFHAAIDRGMKHGIEEGLKQGIQQGIQQGHKQGLKEGKEQGIIEVARNLKNTGMHAEQIASVTGLSADQIESL